MSQIFDAIGIALSSIWVNKIRSLMMVLGNIVAVTSIIAVVSLLQGMNGYVADAILRDVGAGTFKVDKTGVTTSREEEDTAWRRNPNITMLDAKAISTFDPQLIDSVMAESGAGANVTWGTETLESTRVRGVSADYEDFSGYTAEQGRLPSRTEVEAGRNVALIGWDTADKLFKGRNPVDKVIQVNGTHFTVLGVSEKKGSVFGMSQDEFVVIPLAAFQRLFGSRRSLEITVKPVNPDDLVPAMDAARVAMRVRRHLRPREADNFGLYTSDTLMDLWKQFSSGAFAILVGVVSLSLVVGGVVIMNIMLMIVSERTREIGLRKALGAKKRDIVWQVLTESTTLSTVGGLIGTLLGFGVALLVSTLTPIPARIEPWSVPLGLGMTAVVGMFFGMYPAMRAAALDPIEALRKE
jgi:putative ABC transport system permease protein